MDSEQPSWPPRYPTGGTEIQGPPPHQYGPGPGPGKAPRDNGATWLWCLGFGAVAVVAIAVANVAREPGQSAAYSSGQALPAGLAPAVLVALLATNTSRFWPAWVIGTAVLSSAGLLYLVMSVAPELENDRRAQESGEADYVLTTPEQAGHWRLLNGSGAQAREEALMARIATFPDDMLGDTVPVIAEYQRAQGERLAFLGLNVSGGEFQDGLRESAEQSITDFLAGAGLEESQVFEPGDLGGALACSDQGAGLPAGYVACGWADGATMGQVTYAVGEISLEEAAGLTRDFRAHVTEVGS